LEQFIVYSNKKYKNFCKYKKIKHKKVFALMQFLINNVMKIFEIQNGYKRAIYFVFNVVTLALIV